MENEVTTLELVPAAKTCTRCKNIYPATEEFFYNSGRRTKSGVAILKTECKNCTKELRNLNRAAQRAQGFVWDKTTQARFKNIAKTIKQNELTPSDILKLNRAKAAKFSYNLGARLNLIKYAINNKHPEAMETLFHWKIETPEPQALYQDTLTVVLEEEKEQEPMTIKLAAERLLNCEERLEYAKQDLMTAQKMLQDAEEELSAIRMQRNEAVLFLTNFAKEMNLDDG